MESVSFRFSTTTILLGGSNPKCVSPFRLLQDRGFLAFSPTNRRLVSSTNCSAKHDTETNNGADYPCMSPSTAYPVNTNNPPLPGSPNSSFPESASPEKASAFSRGLLFDLGTAGSWDSREVGSPVVKRFISDEEERWYLWYYGNSGEKRNQTGNNLDSIGLAVSSNGVHWERGSGPVESSGDAGMVMECCADWWAFDTLSIRPSEVVVMSSSKVRASSAVYWLYYTGFFAEEPDGLKTDEPLNARTISGENPERFALDHANLDNNNARIFKSLPGLAISQDGRHWARIEGEHHSGALFDVGSRGEWDALFIANPHVVVHQTGDLRMYYHSMDGKTGEFGIGVARSRDGMKWLKLGKILGAGKGGYFDELGATNACVVKLKTEGESKYLMAYEGVGADGSRSIGLAVSGDGLRNWSRITDEAVLKPSNGERWDNKEVGSPYLVQMDGDVDAWRLYYRGVGYDGRTGIGMATSRGGQVPSFRRWTGFQLT